MLQYCHLIAKKLSNIEPFLTSPMGREKPLPWRGWGGQKVTNKKNKKNVSSLSLIQK